MATRSPNVEIAGHKIPPDQVFAVVSGTGIVIDGISDLV